MKYLVTGYKCDIDTGKTRPMSYGNVHYDPQESKIMERNIGALLVLQHICDIKSSDWMAKALLEPKPHQESVHAIVNFKWRFCVNYVKLNHVTKVMLFPIPRRYR